MNPVWMAAIIIAGTITMTGCVSDRKYQEALAETEAAKTELATTRAQKSALEQQVKTLKDLNVKFGNEAQAARDELERIQYGRDKERGSAESRTKELEDRADAHHPELPELGGAKSAACWTRSRRRPAG